MHGARESRAVQQMVSQCIYCVYASRRSWKSTWTRVLHPIPRALSYVNQPACDLSSSFL